MSLPVEIWAQIAMIDSTSYNLVVRSIRSLYKWAINPTLQKELKKKWLIRDGVEYFLPNGWYHREDGPARIADNGCYIWYRDGKIHRIGGPAIDSPVHSEWWVDGLKHREDGPAVDALNRKEWWQNGQLHREDGPAIIGNIYTEYHVRGEFVYRKFYK
jgi:hypothetical protein